MSWALIIFYRAAQTGAAVTTLHFGTEELAAAARRRLGPEINGAYGLVVQVACE